MNLLSIIKVVVGLGKLLQKGLLTLFLVRTGINKEVLKGAKKDVKDAKKAARRKNHIATLSDDDLDSGL